MATRKMGKLSKMGVSCRSRSVISHGLWGYLGNYFPKQGMMRLLDSGQITIIPKPEFFGDFGGPSLTKQTTIFSGHYGHLPSRMGSGKPMFRQTGFYGMEFARFK